MDLANLQQNLPVLVVALLTWGGVFLYLLRVERLTRDIENRLARQEDSTLEDTTEARDSKLETRNR